MAIPPPASNLVPLPNRNVGPRPVTPVPLPNRNVGPVNNGVTPLPNRIPSQPPVPPLERISSRPIGTPLSPVAAAEARRKANITAHQSTPEQRAANVAAHQSTPEQRAANIAAHRSTSAQKLTNMAEHHITPNSNLRASDNIHQMVMRKMLNKIRGQ